MRFIPAASFVALAVLAAAVPQPAERRTGMVIPITKRSNLVHPDKSVDLDVLNSHIESVNAKIHLGLENYEKNTGTAHPFAKNGFVKRGVALTGANYGMSWYGTISVGTPAQPLTVVMDTGSGDLLVPASTCDSNCTGHTLWDPSASTTSKDLGKKTAIGYGGEVAAAIVEQYTDTVAVAGFRATSQTLGAATQYPAMLKISRFPADGVMGMSFESITTFGASPVFQTLVAEGQVTDSVFSFKLSSPGAELYIGGSDSSSYTGDFTYTPVTQQGFWQVSMDHVQANGKTILSDLIAIIDTGTSLIIGTPSQVSSLHSSLGGRDLLEGFSSGYYTFPCVSFPNISLIFGGTPFEVPASTLNLGPIHDGSPDCISGISGQAYAHSFWIIGDVFLRGVYTTFDVGKSQVGFAHLA